MEKTKILIYMQCGCVELAAHPASNKLLHIQHFLPCAQLGIRFRSILVDGVVLELDLY